MRSLQGISGAPAGGISPCSTCIWAFLSTLGNNHFFSNLLVSPSGMVEPRRLEAKGDKGFTAHPHPDPPPSSQGEGILGLVKAAIA